MKIDVDRMLLGLCCVLGGVAVWGITVLFGIVVEEVFHRPTMNIGLQTLHGAGVVFVIMFISYIVGGLFRRKDRNEDN